MDVSKCHSGTWKPIGSYGLSVPAGSCIPGAFTPIRDKGLTLETLLSRVQPEAVELRVTIDAVR
jgi:hypothetical protein